MELHTEKRIAPFVATQTFDHYEENAKAENAFLPEDKNTFPR